MFQGVLNIWGWNSLPFGLAPITLAQQVLTPEEASVVFSGPKILVALVAGVLMAFAFQLLFTNFSVAVGISSWEIDSDSDDESEGLGKTIRKVQSKVGAWVLITASIALFIASFLAVKLSLIESESLGAIIGVVIWSTYFSLVIWLGSSALGSLIGSISNTVTSGFQALMGTATAGIGANAAKKQLVSTAEDITAAVRRELTSGFDPEGIKNTLQSSLGSLQLPKLDVKEIRTQFDQLLKDTDLQSIANSELLKNIDRQTFIDLISSRTDFSKEEINGIADQFQGAWQQALNRQNPTEQVINLLKSATPEELNSEQLGERLQQLVTFGGGNGNGVIKQAIRYGLSAAAPAVLERVNLSDIDVSKITTQLQKLKEKVQDVDVDRVTEQFQEFRKQATKQVSTKLPISLENAIKADVEDYILNSFPWHFNRITLVDEFKEVIYDVNADPTTVRRELEEINQEYFTNLLKQRDDLGEARVKEISEQMESDRLEVLETVKQAQTREKGQDFRTRIEDYLRSTGKEELNPEGIERDFGKLLDDPQAGFEDLSSRFGQFDRDTFVQLLSQRQDISEEEANNIVGQLERNRDNVLNRARELQEQAKAKADELRQRVEDYLRNTNKDELNPEAIKREFKVLLDDPQAGISLLRSRLAQFDRDTLVQLLSQRQDLSEEQVNQTLDQLESVRDSILQVPQQAKEQYEKTTKAIAEYLRNTNLEELDPEGIRSDLEKLLDDPKAGALALRDRLSHVDRETLVQLVSQRGDLSQEQVNQIIDRAQDAIGDIIKAPKRLAKRTTQVALDFEANLEEYLRNTNKDELNPEGIKRDLQLLLSSPRAGIGSLSDRASKFDRSTIVALLSQREDISEEEANRIVDQIDSVRSSIVEQFQQIQERVQSVLDGVFAKVRNYLNSLDRSELNYEGIKQDFSKVFDDPQAGFEALRDRLSQFDRDTLVAVISSREDISEADANRIIDQIESARDGVLQRAERIQQETQKRLKAIQHQAKKQAEESKKTVANAAWWIFGTAITSLAASAIAGATAVAGIPLPR
ncbi:MAG: MFS transporter [Nostoc sp. DedVER02]|uniref:MFS transporter n=1 Tax=unclassified Nostoc TaxID=2593658 RepID=UPI002AD26DA8|nr:MULTISPECIES: MFS transporter [unclassified Nostoc]MDZ7984857.1 MFS transporter [Nostoc sp. DedVER02]MDZ8111045.1 MFS transporter [Nostoc sp. DedVER01b]